MASSGADASITRLATIIGPHVTNGIVDGQLALASVPRQLWPSNKVDKIRQLLAWLLRDGRRLSTAEQSIHGLLNEALARSLNGKASLQWEQVDDIIDELKLLRIPPGDVASPAWRKGLKRASPIGPSASTPLSPAAPPNPAPHRVAAKIHHEALKHLQTLALDSANPKLRGRQLERVVESVLMDERLAPERTIVSPGEELDLGFALDGQQYLIECKWELEHIGLPAIRDFAEKVRTKAEGTFGVVISMSGFVHDINEKASRGVRLNSVGIDHGHVMAVLEGRKTFSDVVRLAREKASRRTLFFTSFA